jgi:SAM-dependent methyltransferase
MTSRELGLEIGAICGKHLLKLKHLHYGYWTNGLDVEIGNLHIAQENYTNFLISHIPDSVKTILDVGCGTGQTARKLIDMGYQVDCVSPSAFLAERGRSLLGNKSEIFECPYELLETENRYDLIMFSESFQYIPLEKSLEKTARLLNDDGYLLICDVFEKAVKEKNVLGGGYRLTRFHELIAHLPFELVTDIDITEQTAPNLDIQNVMSKNIVIPVLDSGLAFLNAKYPFTSRLIRWKYKKKINKAYQKHAGEGRTSEAFKKFKSYRLFLYRKVRPSINE